MYRRSQRERNGREPRTGSEHQGAGMAASSTDQAAYASPPPPGTRAGAVAVIGGGSIGAAFALLFAAAGRPVRVQEIDAARRDAILATIATRLEDLHRFGLASEPVDAVLARVTVVAELATAVDGADYVQECAPEDLDLKRRLFAGLDQLVPADALLASASSAIPASRIAEGLA